MENGNVVVKKVCHSRMSLSGIYNACRCNKREQSLFNRCVEDPRLQSSGMTPLFNNGGFTLIELLVVVLIIGILAEVAVPQYQLAVDKSRFSAAMPYVKALDEAQQIYYLANGEYSEDWNLLDIGFPQGISVDQYNRPRFGQLLLQTNKTFSVGFLLDNNENRYVSYAIYRTKNTMSGVSVYGKSTCLSYGTDNLTRGDKICKAFNGQFITQSTVCGTTIDGETLKCNIYLLE